MNTEYAIAEKIRSRLEQPYNINLSCENGNITVSHHCSVSIGVTVFLGNTESQENIFNRADGAMYAAKSLGRNQVHCAD